MELLCPEIDIPQQNIVRENALDKGGLVVLLLEVGLGAVQGHRRHGTDCPGQVILSRGEHSIVELGSQTVQCFKCISILDDQSPVLRGDGLH